MLTISPLLMPLRQEEQYLSGEIVVGSEKKRRENSRCRSDWGCILMLIISAFLSCSGKR